MSVHTTRYPFIGGGGFRLVVMFNKRQISAGTSLDGNGSFSFLFIHLKLYDIYGL